MLIRGIVPVLNTPFHENGGIDFASQERLVEHLLAQGAHGLGLFANASEGYTLTAAERVELMRGIVRQVDGRVPLVASSGHTGTDAAVALSRELEDLGADCLMVLPPFYLKTDADGLLHYYNAISDAVSIPIMVQDAPLMTQVAMPPALLAKLAAEVERVEYVKVEAPATGPKITAVRRQTGDGLHLFGGLNCQFIIEETQRGACGQMPGSDRTRELVEIWDLLHAGQADAAWAVFGRILPLLRFELQPGLGVSAQKHNLVAAGVIAAATVRHPTAALTAESLRELHQLRRLADQTAGFAAT